MTTISYAAAGTPVRADIVEAHQQLWQKLAEAGTWWTGVERVAIAGEVRKAWTCTLCTDRKAALSASAVDGQHDTYSVLPSPVVEMIHRVTTDPGRLSKHWYERLLADGVEDTHYVEALGVVVRTVSIDSFCRGLGIPPHPLPTPIPGDPSRRRPPQVQNGSFLGADDSHVIRAMSLVPDEVRASIHTLITIHYLEFAQAMDPASNGDRAISRSQIELLAAHVSALNQCFY